MRNYTKNLSLCLNRQIHKRKNYDSLQQCAISSRKKILLKTLQFTLGSDVRSQNIQLPIMRITSNIYGKEFMWSWLKNNWKKIHRKAGIGNPLLKRVVDSIGHVVTANQEKEVRQFFKNNPVRGTEMTLEQTLERVRIRSKFLTSLKKEFR